MLKFSLAVFVLIGLVLPLSAEPETSAIDQQIAALTARIEALEKRIAAVQAAQPLYVSPGSTLRTEVTPYGTVMQTYSDLTHAYRWRFPDSDTSQVALFDGATQIGAYHYGSGKYQQLSAAKVWGEYAQSPIAVPAQPKPITSYAPATYQLPTYYAVPNCSPRG